MCAHTPIVKGRDAMPVAPWQSLRLPPRIDEGYSRRLEISDVAGDHRHAMHEGSGRDECIALAALVGYMQPGAA